MIFKPSSLHKFFFTYICPRFYGGGSPPATPSQTTQTVNQNTIPAELMPYVKNMLNRAEPLSQSAYVPYSTNAEDYVAPFSPLQKQAQAGAANLQTPGQFAPASQMAGLSGLGSMTAGAQYAQQATNPNAVGAYMNPYLQQSLAPQLQLLNQQFGIKGAQQQGAATQAGAFGGSREALTNAMTNQGQALAQQEMIGQGYNQAFGQAQQAQQFGANLGLQGYGQGIQAAGQLGQLGTQQLGAETSVLGTQAQLGGQQQAQQQQAINQAIQNYQNAQQYPYMQLGFMSDLLRGTPVGNVTQTQYQAQPGMASQLGGLAATGLGAYAALKAKGGAIKDKGYAKGGIVGYKVGGEIEESMRSKLEDLDIPHLQQAAQNKESPKMASIAKEVLATKFARGGIVAFADDKDKEKGSQVDEEEVIGGVKPLNIRPKKMLAMQEQAPPVQAAGIAPVQAAPLGPMSTEESLKNMAANQAQGIKPPLQTSTMSATPAVRTPFNMDAAISGIQEEAEKSRVAANVDLKDLIAEDRATRERELGPDTATAEYRKSIMEEKANSKDEIRRQMGIRLMEFGANWASTPGAPLIAGMKALKEELPLYMEDTKANKKAMKELDQSIYLLDHAKRLEDEGYIDRATAQKQRAQDTFMKIAPQAIDASVKKQEIILKEQELKNTSAYQQANLGIQSQSLTAQKEHYQQVYDLAKDTNMFEKTKPTPASSFEKYVGALKTQINPYTGQPYTEAAAYGKAYEDQGSAINPMASELSRLKLAGASANAALKNALKNWELVQTSDPKSKDYIVAKTAIEAAQANADYVAKKIAEKTLGPNPEGPVEIPQSSSATPSSGMPGLDSLLNKSALEAEMKKRGL